MVSSTEGNYSQRLPDPTGQVVKLNADESQIFNKTKAKLTNIQEVTGNISKQILNQIVEVYIHGDKEPHRYNYYDYKLIQKNSQKESAPILKKKQSKIFTFENAKSYSDKPRAGMEKDVETTKAPTKIPKPKLDPKKDFLKYLDDINKQKDI